MPLLLALHGLFFSFLCTLQMSLSVKGIGIRILRFDLLTFAFELHLYKHHVFQFRKSKAADFFQTPIFEKKE
jgi:citrate lyase synthetase